MVTIWPKIWENIHNQFFTEEIKSTVWSQIHLNFYTTYNYNKWHNTLNPCPLCNKIPESIYHIILYCNFTVNAWYKLEKTLHSVLPKSISSFEQASGRQPATKREEPATILRNWITFSLRHHIMKEERKAYYRGNYKNQNIDIFLKQFQYTLHQELQIKFRQYKARGLLSIFEKIALVGNVLGEIADDKLNCFEFKLTD